MGLWPRGAVTVCLILKNWLVIVIGMLDRLLEVIFHFRTAVGFKINLPPCTTYLPENVIKTVACSYCKEEKYNLCRGSNPIIPWFLQSSILFAGPKADSKK